MNPSSRDAGIPVLTEIISPFAENDEQESDSRPVSDSASALVPASDSVLTPDPDPVMPVPGLDAAPISPAESDSTDYSNDFEAQTASRLSEEDWKRLERRIRERILTQILARTDAILEQRIRDSLADVLQLALEGLTAQIKDGLHQSLEDVISRAISQEITRLQGTKK